MPGNEAADKAAKEATRERVITLPHLTRSDCKLLFRGWQFSKWREKWRIAREERGVGLHLFQIKKQICFWPWTNIPNDRKLETALARLRLGHSGLRASSHRFGLALSPLCDCGLPETVAHLFMECVELDVPRLILRRTMISLGVPWSLTTLLGGGDSAYS